MATLLARSSRKLAASKAVLSGTNGLRAAVVVPRRTWFGFGMPKDDDEIAREGQAGIPLYQRKQEVEYSAYKDVEDEEEWTAEEKLERESLASMVFSMAEAQPQVAPDLEFFKKVFSLLMKYDDWRGVMAAKNLAAEGGVDIDTDGLLTAVDAYLADAKTRSYHQGGKW